MTLHKGDLVTVEDHAGARRASILHIEEPATMTGINGAAEVERLRAIMRDANIRELALIAPAGQPPFIAVRTPHGWTTLQGQRLTLTPGKVSQEKVHARTKTA